VSNKLNKTRRTILLGAAALSTGLAAAGVHAAEPLKVGLIVPMSGPFASTGKQVDAAVKLFMQQNGSTVAGRQVQIILKDDGGVSPDVTKRIAQELVARDKVQVLAGFGLTPLAFAAAPVATQAKVPMIVMNAATSVIPQRSPYIVRSGFTLAQVTAPMAQWAAKNNIKSVVTFVSDYGPGIDAEKVFVKDFTKAGGKIVATLRAPLRNPDYAPFLARVKDAKPDAVFVFVPAGEQSIAFMKGYRERGLAAAGVKVIATGDLTDDHVLPAMGDNTQGVITTFHYSAAHKSPENDAFLKSFAAANPQGGRPNFMAVAAYDGMNAIYQVSQKLNGKIDGDKAMAVLKGMKINSPRGPISIDPATRDVVQTVYVRKVEMVNGQPYNIEFDQFPNQKDPGK